MTQQTEMVQTVQNFEELQNLGRKNLVAMMKQFKQEDTDCLANVNGKSKNEELVEALAEHMGFTATVEAEIKAEVNKDITETIQSQDEESDVMDFGEDVPSLQESLFSDTAFQSELQVEVITVTDNEPVKETSGDADVDDVLAELGLDNLAVLPTEEEEDLSYVESDEAAEQAEAENAEFAKLVDQMEAEEKPKKKGVRKATIPMDAPIPVRQFQNLLIGVYGNVLEEREEPFPEGHKFEGLTHEEIKLERFNPKAHESFRKTKGNMHLVYTNVGSTYLIIFKKADGTVEPVLEVANKGRGHLRCKQIANHLQVAYNEKNDQEVISAEEYQKLASQIELLPINAESVEA